MIVHSRTYVAAPPGFTIKELIDDRGISEAQLAASLDESEPFVQKLIEGETELTADLAARLAAFLGMNARFWLGLERGYREDLAKVAAENAQDAEDAEDAVQEVLPAPPLFAV